VGVAALKFGAGVADLSERVNPRDRQLQLFVGYQADQLCRRLGLAAVERN
jgi:hypothetical protein